MNADLPSACVRELTWGYSATRGRSAPIAERGVLPPHRRRSVLVAAQVRALRPRARGGAVRCRLAAAVVPLVATASTVVLSLGSRPALQRRRACALPGGVGFAHSPPQSRTPCLRLEPIFFSPLLVHIVSMVGWFPWHPESEQQQKKLCHLPATDAPPAAAVIDPPGPPPMLLTGTPVRWVSARGADHRLVASCASPARALPRRSALAAPVAPQCSLC